ncbi:hypothetical protein NDU88_006519 [Pleurodeles waltl]|uniref:Uncharacterized protein n=1 Tax=Pleurodeles waltl TaxID=8319 RepID=A0AAV7TYJ5_PLEWA|nr:hypothetical protein NDU88_006519 [Pleurodeles waltl]
MRCRGGGSAIRPLTATRSVSPRGVLLFIVPNICGRLGPSGGSPERPLRTAQARRRYRHRSSLNTCRAGSLGALGPLPD